MVGLVAVVAGDLVVLDVCYVDREVAVLVHGFAVAARWWWMEASCRVRENERE